MFLIDWKVPSIGTYEPVVASLITQVFAIPIFIASLKLTGCFFACLCAMFAYAVLARNKMGIP
jgi:hypothetical protein